MVLSTSSQIVTKAPFFLIFDYTISIFGWIKDMIGKTFVRVLRSTWPKKLTPVSKFGDYRNSDGISSEGKSSDYFKKKISVSANSVSIFWALKYIESKLSD